MRNDPIHIMSQSNQRVMSLPKWIKWDKLKGRYVIS